MTREEAFGRGARGAIMAVLAVLAFYGAWSTSAVLSPWGFSAASLLLLPAWGVAAAWALTVAVRAPSSRSLALFVVFAAALRIFSAWLVDGRVSPGDSHWYLILAGNLLDGRGLVMIEPFMGVACRALFPPVYPLILAGWGAIAGFSTPSLLILSTLIDIATALLILRLGAAIAARRAGAAAALLYLIWPSAVLSAPLAQKEGLGILLIVALALAWVRVARGESTGWRRSLSLGVPAAMLALLQPGQAPLAILFGIALLPKVGWRKLLLAGVQAAAVAAAVMMPWWIRNWFVFGAFVPLTTAGGISLWIGNNPNATGNWMPQPTFLHGVDELTYGRAAAALAREWIMAHPGDFVRLTATKFVRAVGIGQSGVLRLAAMNPPVSAAIAGTILPLSQAAHVLLLAGGAFAVRLRRDPAMALAVALLGASLLQIGLFATWFEFGERHREFVTPFLLLPIGVAAARLAPTSKPRARPIAA